MQALESYEPGTPGILVSAALHSGETVYAVFPSFSWAQKWLLYGDGFYKKASVQLEVLGPLD